MKIKKNYFYGLIGLIILLIVIPIGYKYFTLQPIKANDQTTQQTPTPVIAVDDALPISSKHPNIVNATAFYTFVGPVEKLTDTTIAIKSQSTPLPTFTITGTTDYYEIIGGVPQKIDKSLVNSSSVVNLTTSYNYTNKQWTLNRITLVPPPVSPTP